MKPQHVPVYLELVDTHPDGTPVRIPVTGSLTENHRLLNSDKFVLMEARGRKTVFVINTDRVAQVRMEDSG